MNTEQINLNEKLKSNLISAPQTKPAVVASKVLQYPDEALSVKSKPCIVFNQELEDLFNTLEATMMATRGVGISAIQIGVPFQACIVLSSSGQIIRAVNAQIIGHEDETTFLKEGCLSIPGVYGPVKRFKEITVRYQDLNGNIHTTIAEGLEARIWQHEISHQEGRTILDEVSSFRKSVMLRKRQILQRRKSK